MTGALARYLRSFTGFGRDARLFLLTTVVFGAALSLYWIDFNLYLQSIGLDRPTIGWLLSISQLAGVLVALPASALSNRLGRRTLMAGGMALVAVALFAFLPGNRTLLFVGVAALGAGSQIVSASLNTRMSAFDSRTAPFRTRARLNGFASSATIRSLHSGNVSQ